jgi:hypothetical protein
MRHCEPSFFGGEAISTVEEKRKYPVDIWWEIFE